MIGYYAVTVFPRLEAPVPIPPKADRTKPGRRGGALTGISEDLDARADRIEELGQHLYHYTEVCFERPSEKIRDYVRLDDAKNLVPGPKALH